MPAFKDLTGIKVGRWTVLKRAETRRCERIHYVCKCRCGTIRDVAANSLQHAKSLSCGCLLAEIQTAHGISGTTSYKRWKAMMERCYNPKRKGFENYGGRGIKVCDRWHDVANYLADMGERPEGMSLERINNDGDYSPENCRWATRREQLRNKRTNRFWTSNGETLTLTDWAIRFKMHYKTLQYRIDAGWADEEIRAPETRKQIRIGKPRGPYRKKTQ